MRTYKCIVNILLTVCAMFMVLGTVHAVHAYTAMPEGRTILCSIDKNAVYEDDLYRVRYTVKPSQSGTWVVFTSDAEHLNSRFEDKNGKAVEQWKHTTSEDDYIWYSVRDLTAGEEYTLEFSSFSFQSFYAGIYLEDSDQTVIQTTDVTITDDNNGYPMRAFSFRAYKTVNGKKCFSTWSKKKTVKTK